MTSRVDPAGARQMMAMAVNLYADRKLAVVREYVSNAVDATRAAGSTEAVRVSVPTELDPTLVVADRGTGMTFEELENYCLAFAASTKRESNDLIGQFGVGAKSAWTLTESFLIDTVRDGRRTIVRAAANLCHQILVNNQPTSLANGTTVAIPVEIAGDARRWADIAKEVAGAHDPGVVLVDGDAVPSLAGETNWIGSVLPRKVATRDEAVTFRSAGTLYAAVPEMRDLVQQRTGLTECVVELPAGSFDITPSRESVSATARTKNAVDGALELYGQQYAIAASRVDRLARRDLTAGLDLRAALLGGGGTADHLPIDLSLAIVAAGQVWTYLAPQRGGMRRCWLPGGGTYTALDVPNEMRRTLVISGFPPDRELRNFASKVRQHFYGIRRVITLREGEESLNCAVLNGRGKALKQSFKIGAHTAGVTHVAYEQWAEINARPRGRSVSRTQYRCLVIRDARTAAEECYLSSHEIAALDLPAVWVDPGWLKTAAALGKACVLVDLGRKSVGPLRKVVPGLVSRTDWMDLQYTAASARWTHSQELNAALLYRKRRADGAGYLWNVFTIAAAASKLIPAGDPKRQLLGKFARVARGGAGSEGRAAQFEELRASRKAGQAIGELTALVDQFRAAYPLMEFLREGCRNLKPDQLDTYVDYVVHVPEQPRPPAA